ncbi:MAG: 16S rRNA (guanine(966)-N(2))-methyltransferase RsmD [Clostridia bacterium]|nr:16S rRNA (guanine(966)-N(2))-methyltransferase RsmD [Clostridia bacterium]
MMRIITGLAKGCRLDTLEGENTRPTGERVKEAMFSMIQFDIEGRNVLDLFAGSGQLGLEALSRGASHATFLDVSKDAVEIIKKNAQKTKLIDRCTISSGDFATFFRAGRKKFDIVFLDPPYKSEHMTAALKKLRDSGFLNNGALIVCESETGDVFGDSPELEDSYEVLKNSRHGRAYITLLSKKKDV